jgi:hypothetical protein
MGASLKEFAELEKQRRDQRCAHSIAADPPVMALVI